MKVLGAWLVRLVVLILFVLACGGRPEMARRGSLAAKHATTQPDLEPGVGAGESCPVRLPGTRVAFHNTADGAAITFRTDQPDRVARLQRSVHRMSMRYPRVLEPDPAESMARTASTSGRTEEVALDRPQQRRAQEVVTAIPFVENLEDGARLFLWPPDAADVESVRAHTRAEADALSRGTCPG